MQRRAFLQCLAGLSAMALLVPFRAVAALWNRAAFESKDVQGALAGLEVPGEIPSEDIEIIAPERAENGAVVQVEVRSRIPGTEAIAILAEKNPTPLIANFMFSHGAEPFVITRIKMAETSHIQAIVKSGDKYYIAKRMVEVLENGCD
ncbi:MAG TPA: thiosulfate oxidation carrier protein SoxY [Methylophilaceae bacterium]|nr:thiosulfate oxidation carrier protein SoxY [Methylophilaceae bacterium]